MNFDHMPKLLFFSPLTMFWALSLPLFLLGAADGGCRRQSPSEVVRPAGEPRSAVFLLEKLHRNEMAGVNTFSARADIFASGNGESVNANANILWIRDSVLWLNVRKFGIEAIRALVTRDSVFVLDRLNDTYTAQGLDALQRAYGLPGGFGLLEHLVLGTAWLPSDASWQAGVQDGLHRLAGANGRFTADYRVEESGWRLRHVSFLEKMDARSLNLDFERFKKLDGAPAGFPYLRRIAAYSPEGGALQLELEFSDVQINVPKAYRFEIPAHYEKVD